MAKKTDDVTFEVKDNLGTVSEDGNVSLQLRLMSWNGGEAKYDLRSWWTDNSGIEKCGKGIRLTKEELLKLAEIIDAMEI